VRSAFAFVERCAATLTELDCFLVIKSDAADRALALCTRLECLSSAALYTPASWLGLSQLHTLRGVDLCVVSMSTIATALPRLHTLDATLDTRDPPLAAVAGFFEDLLPRLQVFNFFGWWPQAETDERMSSPRELPFLRELVWECSSTERQVLRGFMGARPSKIHTSHAMIASWVTTDEGRTVEEGEEAVNSGPLARLRDLCLYGSGGSDSSDVARILRAAPQLRKFAVIDGLRGSPSWYTLTGPPDPAFAGLVHPRLRSVLIQSEGGTALTLDADCAAQLRHRHFARLEHLTVDKHQYFATSG
jgi:hypothetical protein